MAQTDQVQTGARIRVTSSANKLVKEVGVVREVAGDSLVFASDRSSQSWTVAMRELDRLEVSTGRHRKTLTGLGIGLLGGGVTSALIGAAACQDGFFTKAECVAGSGMMGALAGMLIGTIAGAATRTEGWRGVQERKPLAMMVKPLGGGKVAIGVRIGF